MKKVKFKQGIIAVLIGCCPLPNLSAQEAQKPDTLVISLSDALKIALSESPTIKVAEKEIQRVQYAKKETQGGFLPSVSFSAAYQRAIKKQQMYMDGAFDIDAMMAQAFNPIIMGTEGALQTVPGYMPGTLLQAIKDNTPPPAAPSEEGITVGRDNTFTGGISASLPLIAPALWAMNGMTELQLELAVESARSSKLSLKNQVSKAYYGTLMAKDSYSVFKRAYENSIENARIAKNKFEQGTMSEFDWIRADVQARNALTNLVSAESAVNLSILQLKMLIGIDMFTEVKTVGSLSDFEATMYGDYLAIDTTTLKDNSDLKQFDIQTKQLEQSLKINKSSALPTLGLQFDYNYMSMVNDDQAFTNSHKWFPVSNLSVGLSVPLFQGLSKHNKNQQIKVQIDEMALNRMNLERGLQLQAINSLENIKKSLKKIESDKQAMLMAEKAMTISQKMYDVGMATYLDVTNAELAYTQSGLMYNQSIFEYLSNKSDLEKIFGK